SPSTTVRPRYCIQLFRARLAARGPVLFHAFRHGLPRRCRHSSSLATPPAGTRAHPAVAALDAGCCTAAAATAYTEQIGKGAPDCLFLPAKLFQTRFGSQT